MAKTIGFYLNFNLNLQRLSTALRCIKENSQLGHDDLAKCMGVNRPVAEGFSAWLTHTGLAITGASEKARSLTYRNAVSVSRMASAMGAPNTID